MFCKSALCITVLTMCITRKHKFDQNVCELWFTESALLKTSKATTDLEH